MSAPPFRLSGQGIEDHAVGYHDTDDLAHIHLEGGAHHGGGHGHHALIQDRTDNHIADGCLIHRRAADKDGGHGGHGHPEGAVVQLYEAEALLIHQNTHSTQPGGHDHGDKPHLVHVDARCAGKGGVGAHSGHGGAGLGVQERPHQHGHQHEEQQRTGGDHQIDADAVQVDGQNVGQRLVVIALQRDDGTQTAGGEAPHHGGVLVRQQQPHHAHEGHGREAHVGGDHHLAALDLVQQPAVAAAEQQGKGRGDEDGHKEAGKAGVAQLDGQRGTQQSGHDTQRQAEVQAAAGVYHGHHGQHHHGVPAETGDDIGDLCGEIQPHAGRGDEQQQQEARDDQTRQAEAVQQLSEF